MIPNRFFITGLLLILTNHLHSQHGTLIYAGIASDGIVLTTDSRMVFVDQHGARIAAIDSSNKIHLIKGFPVAMAGYSSWGKQNIYEIVKDFNKLELSSLRIDSVMREFHQYFINEIRKEPTENRKDFAFIAIGYQKDTPVIIRITQKSFELYHKGIASNLEQINRPQRIIAASNPGETKVVAGRLAIDMEKSMTEKIKTWPGGTSTYGFPITTVQLLRNRITPQIKNDFRSNSNEIDFSILKEKIISGQRKVVYFVPNGMQQFVGLLDHLISIQQQ